MIIPPTPARPEVQVEKQFDDAAKAQSAKASTRKKVPASLPDKAPAATGTTGGAASGTGDDKTPAGGDGDGAKQLAVAVAPPKKRKVGAVQAPPRLERASFPKVHNLMKIVLYKLALSS